METRHCTASVAHTRYRGLKGIPLYMVDLYMAAVQRFIIFILGDDQGISGNENGIVRRIFPGHDFIVVDRDPDLAILVR
jgi:hypothetical protein